MGRVLSERGGGGGGLDPPSPSFCKTKSHGGLRHPRATVFHNDTQPFLPGSSMFYYRWGPGMAAFQAPLLGLTLLKSFPPPRENVHIIHSDRTKS